MGFCGGASLFFLPPLRRPLRCIPLRCIERLWGPLRLASTAARLCASGRSALHNTDASTAPTRRLYRSPPLPRVFARMTRARAALQTDLRKSTRLGSNRLAATML
mmetsp:Transcript_23054/g.77843  ORF Transcript_23054/g.77843 Transcript_23054/m.77843 type:complete len:105 (-) Transcript_23054:947-1261(-)